MRRKETNSDEQNPRKPGKREGARSRRSNLGRQHLHGRLALAVTSLLLIVGCSSPVEATLAVEGPIVEMTFDPRLIILVQAAPNVCGYKFLVDSRTKIFRAGSILTADTDD